MGDRVRLRQILIAIDQLANTLLGGMADETISARAYRNDWTLVMRIIDWMFQDPNHCKDAYYSEVFRSQLPKDYERG